MKTRNVSFHIDMDSPQKILEFWGVKNISYSKDDLNRFYEISMSRAISLFEEYGIHITFFAVGEELECSEKARDLVKKAYRKGHEIANHTFSHTLSPTKLGREKLRDEIEKCSDVIKGLTGKNPVGFRAPGYDINGSILDILEELSFTYDSSAFWTILNPLWKCYRKIFYKNSGHSGFGESGSRLPNMPYYPSRNNWQERGPYRGIIEVPLPRTKIFNMPFYNNFHLSMDKIYRRLDINMMKSPYFVYLFHLIEFVDSNDNIPKELYVHPNTKIGITDKLNIMRDTISRIVKKSRPVKTDEFVKQYGLSLNYKDER